MQQQQQQQQRVNHVLRYQEPLLKNVLVKQKQKGYRYSFWKAPLQHLSKDDFVIVQANHFLLVSISSFLAIFISLLIGASFGDMASIGPPNIGVYGILVGLGHIFPLYIAFNVRTWDYYDVRINPYITLMEFVGHQAIGFWSFVVEILAQAVGATVGGAFAYGVLKDTAPFIAGVSAPVINTSLGFAFVLELLSGFFMGFVYFHNWYHDNTIQMPLTMAYVVGGFTAISFPYIGTTTHNPFRYAAACIVESTCGGRGWWIYVFGPLAGVILGFVAHLGTMRINK